MCVCERARAPWHPGPTADSSLGRKTRESPKDTEDTRLGHVITRVAGKKLEHNEENYCSFAVLLVRGGAFFSLRAKTSSKAG